MRRGRRGWRGCSRGSRAGSSGLSRGGGPGRTCAALLAPLAGKNGWTLAEVAGDRSPGGMQRLLNAARWDADGVRDDLRGYVVEHLGEPGGVLIVDETGFVGPGPDRLGRSGGATRGRGRHPPGSQPAGGAPQGQDLDPSRRVNQSCRRPRDRPARRSSPVRIGSARLGSPSPSNTGRRRSRRSLLLWISKLSPMQNDRPPWPAPVSESEMRGDGDASAGGPAGSRTRRGHAGPSNQGGLRA